MENEIEETAMPLRPLPVLTVTGKPRSPFRDFRQSPRAGTHKRRADIEERIAHRELRRALQEAAELR